MSINNPKFGDYINIIYPVELEIKDTTDADHHASYLDLLLKYDNFHRLQIKLYDKRDNFNFDIVNFPFLCSNIPQSPANGVFVSQLIRYARASSMYEDFIMRSQLLSSKLLKQGFTRNRLIATFKKFVGRHSVLVDVLIFNYNSKLWACGIPVDNSLSKPAATPVSNIFHISFIIFALHDSKRDAGYSVIFI